MISHLEQPIKLESKKEVVLFPEIDRVKFFLSLTRPHSQMIIRIHIFNFKKQQTNSKKTNKTNKQINKQKPKKAKETKEEKTISPVKKIPAARVKIFFVTRISENKIFFWPRWTYFK